MNSNWNLRLNGLDTMICVQWCCRFEYFICRIIKLSSWFVYIWDDSTIALLFFVSELWEKSERLYVLIPWQKIYKKISYVYFILYFFQFKCCRHMKMCEKFFVSSHCCSFGCLTAKYCLVCKCLHISLSL
jgi:hypothetical protein